jgi:hypothetical protein
MSSRLNDHKPRLDPLFQINGTVPWSGYVEIDLAQPVDFNLPSQKEFQMRRLLENPGLRIHLIVYVAVNILLLLINLSVSPHHLWFYWPALGWGLGIVGHAFLVHRKQTPHPFNASTELPAPPKRV